jgi:hypothetical protein
VMYFIRITINKSFPVNFHIHSIRQIILLHTPTFEYTQAAILELKLLPVLERL